jgi:predicted GNAT family N-acyltransferase
VAATRVEVLDWEEARKQAGPIRYAIFFEFKEPPPGVELDDVDAQSAHAVAFDEDGKAVGTGRLQPDGQIGHLAVLKDARRRGIGAALIAALIAEARKRGFKEVSLSAPLQAAEFYRGFGFAAEGKVYQEAGALHQKMRMTIV